MSGFQQGESEQPAVMTEVTVGFRWHHRTLVTTNTAALITAN